MPSEQVYDIGDRVRIAISDSTDPHYQYHRQHGEIVGVLGDETETDREGVTYRVRVESGETVDLRWREVRPPSR